MRRAPSSRTSSPALPSRRARCPPTRRCGSAISGGSSRNKGAHLLLDALERLPPEGWTLDVAGTGDDAYIAALTARAPANVRFLGWTAAADFFARIDALVVPSLWPDPQPRVVFEAYMHGVPVIGARAGGIPEQIDENRTGWLFEAGSAADLAGVLGGLTTDRRDRALEDAYADA